MYLLERRLLHWSLEHVVFGDDQLQDLAQFIIELEVAVRLLLQHFTEDDDQVTEFIKLLLCV